MQLSEITYGYIINLAKFFIAELNVKNASDLQRVCDLIKTRVSDISDIVFTFDETIWNPEEPELYKDLVQFTIQLRGSYGIVPFRLFLSKGMNQNAIILNKNYEWSEYQPQT